MEDGLTNEERSVKDLLATQIFERPAPGIVEQRRAEARRSAGMPQKQRPALKAYTVGIIDVYREEDTTYVETLHEDLDRETLPFAQFLRQHAFHEDINKSTQTTRRYRGKKSADKHAPRQAWVRKVRASQAISKAPNTSRRCVHKDTPRSIHSIRLRSVLLHSSASCRNNHF